MRAALLALALLASGCMYRWGYEPVAGATAVAVPIFENKTLRRGYEYSLTEYVRRRVLDATPLQLAREGSGAPIVRGAIVSVSEGVLIPNASDVDPPLESSISITVRVSVVKPSGEPLVAGPAIITESESWVPALAQSRDSAADRVLRKVAERVVDLLEAGWGGEPPGER